MKTVCFFVCLCFLPSGEGDVSDKNSAVLGWVTILECHLLRHQKKWLSHCLPGSCRKDREKRKLDADRKRGAYVHAHGDSCKNLTSLTAYNKIVQEQNKKRWATAATTTTNLNQPQSAHFIGPIVSPLFSGCCLIVVRTYLCIRRAVGNINFSHS